MTETWLWGASAAAALAYGLVFSDRPSSALRT
ncbi:lysoplasmalogenase, partial [Pseudomonas sp. HMWF010]